jgi:CDGSH-type Zn-finger protein
MARGYRLGDIHPTEEKKMEERTPCGCGRSSTGYCTGLHEMTDEEYEDYLMEHFDEDPDQIGN